MKKYTILTLVMLVLFSTCGNSGTDLPFNGNENGVPNGGPEEELIEDDGHPSTVPSDPADLRINIVMSGDEEGDNVSSSPEYGKIGQEITLIYTLAHTKENNRIVFSGTDPAVEEVDGSGTGERKYVIADKDAVDGVITINAVFTHTDKEFNTIAFADTGNEEKVYGDSFTKAITNTGSGSGAISYDSSDTSVATVNIFGTVTILKVGKATITATKAADAFYEKAEAMYSLTVTPLQLTITAPTVKPKTYDGNTNADITIGMLTNKVIGDTVNVSATANFNSADVANANMINVVYAIDGTSADNYIKPADFLIAGDISKAPGVAVNVNPTAQSKTATSITSSVVTASSGQSVEYAIATAATPVPTTGWQNGLIFSGLTPSTDYYLFARAKESDNYLTGEAKVSSKITTDAPSITVTITMTGNVTGDDVTATPAAGKAGDEITLNYTLANSNANNRLAFSGTDTAIQTVYSAGSGTRKYVINEDDAVQNKITINAAFSHAALVLDEIAFADKSNEEKVYGSAAFTKAITNTGLGSGAISYASSDTSVATVNNSGTVTIVKVGTVTITATKAADATYAQATAFYTLTITQLQLTIANPTVTTTKTYNNGNTTAAVTVGALDNKVGNDVVTVTAAANYASGNAGTNITITVVYTISGANAGNYIKPVNYTVAGTITKATGAATSSQSAGNISVSSKTANSITVNAVNLSSTNPGNQTPEYAISTTNTAPSTGWQDGTTFTGLNANTGYYVFARAKENANYNAGAVKTSALITTDILTTTIAFAAPLTESKPYGTNFTKALSTTGSGTGTITYSSSDTSIAMVDNSGAVTVKKAGGPVTITATKATDGTYAQATATYTLTVTQLQLTIADPNVTTTKTYNNNTTAAVTAGALTNKVGSDDVTVSATATYNSANVADANLITVVYTISGASTANYIKPVSYTTSGTITKAAGGTVTAPTSASKTSTSITVNAVTAPSTGQTVEYASATGTTAPTTGWQDSTTISGLTANTNYYIFARAKENSNYSAGTAQISAQIKTDQSTITVNIVKSGNTGSDNVTASPASGTAGTSITLNYTLAKTEPRNRLTFSGTTAAISEVDSPGTGPAATGTKTYVINETDAVGNIVTINAVFTHSVLETNTIAFADNNNETKVYGSASFTKAITTTGSGTGAITYASGDTSVATVNASGAVTIVKVGTTTITATKAADTTYAQATAEYTLTVTQLQLTKADPTVTKSKSYDGNTTAAVTTVGALNNKVGSDDVTVSAVANYNSATVADANKITVVYSISGAKADNYIKPVDFIITTGCSITKAAGGTINGTVSGTSSTATSITVNAATITTPNSGGQAVEYAVSTSATAPSTGWQDGLTFTGLTTGSEYYIYARAKENANYNAGTAKASTAKVKVDYQANTIAFDTNSESKVYGSASFTKTMTNTGLGSGAITYSSGNTGVATVNASTGAVTIVKVGTATITATKAADGTYAQATASYTLTVTQLQLTKADPTVTTTKTYNGNTSAEVTADGALTNKVSGDDVTVSSVANYASANAGTNITITVVYTIGGTSASNYIKPVDYTIAGTINKAAGGTVSGTVTAASTTSTGITVNSLTVAAPNTGNQTVEYARASSATVPTTGWQDGTTFSGLTVNTNYYFFARAKANDNYNAGTAINTQIRTDLQANIIAFDPTEESKPYGTNFTKTLSTTGSGSGAVTYTSSDTSIATVASGGVVTPVKVGGPITITATKAAQGNYAAATATYTLTITPLQLTIAAPTITQKIYDGTTTVTVTAGALGNKKTGDTVNVSAVGNFNSADVATANKVTVVYTISGTSAGNYIKPVDSVVDATINKATGGTISGNVTMASKTANSITVVAASIESPNKGNQTVEYAYATTTTAPSTGWQDGTTLSGLNSNADYYIFARAKENANYSAGTAKASSQIKTDMAANTIAFDPTEESKPYGANFTKTLSNTGSGTGAVTYSSSDATIATVTNAGLVTPVKAGGPITITATKAAQGIYAQATASYTLTITKAAGAATSSSSAGTPSMSAKTATSITSSTVTISSTNPGNQTIEYAIATSTTLPTTGWQDGTAFTDLTPNTDYYIFARSKENTNYNAGTHKTSAAIKTDALTNTIAFDPTVESKPYGANFTKTLSNSGQGTGAVTYSSSDATIATVTNAGVVTPVKAGGPITITATKAAQGGYPQATASYTLTITKATGGTVSAPTKASVTSTSITVNAVTAPSTGQTVEYAYATTTTAPTNGWQDSTTISGLTANTNYYVFARAKANDNYNAGTASSASAQIKTDAASSAVTTVINFESDALNKTYEFTRGDNDPSSVKVVTDPMRSGQKSLQISSNGPNSDKGYNQAAIIPVKLPYTIKDYQSFSFKFSLVSGNTGTNLNDKSIQVYVAKNSATFVRWGFGNAASAGNQFAANLLGAAPSPAVNFDSTYVGKWTDYTITISNPGSAIENLTGDMFIAIGINCQTNAVYLFDDLTFTPKSNFTPPPPPPSAPSTAPNPPSTGAVTSKNYRNMFTEFGYPAADVTAKVNNAWNKLFVNGTSDEKIYVESGNDMAYIFTADTNDVRSEGMSYGMMMCVQMNDQARFNKLWKWAKTYMYNPTTNAGNNNRGYFAWQCNTNGTRKDQSPAPDGEFYFVTSLLFASARWGNGTGDFNYGQFARQILYDMVHRTPNNTVDPYGAPTMFDMTEKQPVFVPYGNSASHTDPSYHLPAFYEIWALELDNDAQKNNLSGIWSTKAELQADADFYRQAAITSRAFFQKTTNSTTGLGPDYANFNGTPTGGNHADFRFDAWRIALNIGMDYAWWAADSWQKTFANRIQAFFDGKGVTTYKNQWKLDGTNPEGDHSPGLVGCNAVVSLAASHTNAWKFIEDFWNISMTTGTYRYYDGCLYMMSMLHVSGNFKAYLSTNTTPANSSSISPETATFDKKTTATNYKDIAVTMTLNGNTLSNIKNGSTTLTSGTSGNYTQSGSTVTIKKEYLATLAVGTATLTFNFSGGMARELVVTVTDSSNSSISPTTATFDKKTGAQADIVVTMTLNGNTLQSIKNGTTTLTSGTNYTTSGTNNSTVTIKQSYLSTLAVGTATLTFTFSAGATQNLVITVKDTTGGSAGTSYNFATDNLPNGYPKTGGSGISAEVTGGVFVVTKTTSSSTVSIVLPFSVGTGGNISNYSGIKVNIRGVTGDYNYKDLRAWAGTTTSTQLGSVASSLTTTFKDVTIPLSGSLAANSEGIIEIGFGFPSANAYVIEIKSIQLLP